MYSTIFGILNFKYHDIYDIPITNQMFKKSKETVKLKMYF